jgi:hypothetical protein
MANTPGRAMGESAFGRWVESVVRPASHLPRNLAWSLRAELLHGLVRPVQVNGPHWYVVGSIKVAPLRMTNRKRSAPNLFRARLLECEPHAKPADESISSESAQAYRQRELPAFRGSKSTSKGGASI